MQLINGLFTFLYTIWKRNEFTIRIALMPKEHLEKAPEEYLDDMIQKVKMIRELAQKNVQHTQDKNKESYDKNTKVTTFKLNDQVLLKVLKRTPGKKQKLQPRWEEPFYIVKVNPNHSYRLRNAETHVALKSSIHANRLKLYRNPRDFRDPEAPKSHNHENNTLPRENKNDSAARNNTQQQVRDEHRVPDEAPRAYQWHMVKKLLKSKWKNNKRYYLVQWEDSEAYMGTL
jgi:hypothetical protein